MTIKSPQKSHLEPKRIVLLIPITFGAWLYLTSTIDPLPGIGSYNGKRVLGLGLIVLALFVVIFNTPAKQRFKEILVSIPRWVRMLILIFFSLGTLSALLTPHPAYPLTDVATLFLMPLTIIAIACSQQICKRSFDQIALVFIAMTGFGVFIQEVIGLLVFLSHDQQFNSQTALSHFFHPRMYNHLQTWMLPLIPLLPLVFTKYRWVGLLTIFLIGAQWYILFSVGGRGSTVSLFMAMLMISILFPESRKPWLKLQAAGLLLGIIFYTSVIGLMDITQPEHTEFVSESVGRPMLHTSGRTALWNHAFDDAKQNPWLGAGPMRFACNAKNNRSLPASPHSLPVQVIGEWGIPAFLVLGMILTWLLFSWLKLSRGLVLSSEKRHTDLQKATVTCLSISFLAAIVHIFVSGLHIAPSSQVAGMLILGWLLGQLTDNTNATGLDTNKPAADLVLMLGLLISTSVLIFSSQELGEMTLRTSYMFDHSVAAPRFWQEGLFCQYSF